MIAVAVPLLALFSAMPGGPSGFGFGFWPFPRITVQRVLNLPAAVPDKASLESLSRPSGVTVNRIVIDAGHGGRDQGASGPHGVREKDVVLDVAMRLSRLLRSQLGSDVILTRSDDTYLDLPSRVAVANAGKANLFVSIHANSAHSADAAGIETYLPNLTPNAASLSLARLVQTSISADAGLDRGVKHAPFLVLLGVEMPAVLAEIGFLSNPSDERNLSRPEHRQRLAQNLFKGIRRYAESLNGEENQIAARCAGDTRTGAPQPCQPMKTIRQGMEARVLPRKRHATPRNPAAVSDRNVWAT